VVSGIPQGGSIYEPGLWLDEGHRRWDADYDELSYLVSNSHTLATGIANGPTLRPSFPTRKGGILIEPEPFERADKCEALDVGCLADLWIIY